MDEYHAEVNDERLILEDRLYIGGQWLRPSGSQLLDVINPSSGEVVGQVAVAQDVDVDRAVAVARASFDAGTWRDVALEYRVKIIERMCDFFESDLLEVATTLSVEEMGIPIKLSRPMQKASAVQSVRNACRAALALRIETDRPGEIDSTVRLEPVGVVASVAPGNGPLSQAFYMTVYPLLAGCSVVYKPAPESPLTAYLVARAYDMAGLPPGVLSVIQGGPAVGERLTSHPDVDFVFFTGSTETGRKIAATASSQMKRAVLELGGKSAAIILDDADLSVVIPSLVSGVFGNSGQNCCALSRVFAPEALYDEVVAKLSAAADALVVGDPRDEQTDLGPLVSERQLRKVQHLVHSAVEAGAKIANNPPPVRSTSGWFMQPLVLTGMQNSSSIAQTEIFGPVVCVMKYAHEGEAIDLANESSYGLHGAVFSSDHQRAVAIARLLRTGSVSINGNFLNTEQPLGGYRDSGVGRKYGVEGLSEFFEIKTINYGRGHTLFGLADAVPD